MMVTEVASYLDAQLTTLTVGANLFMGIMPEGTSDGVTTPDECVAVFESPGMPPIILGGQVGAGSSRITRPKLQVQARGNPGDYPGARALLKSVVDKLDLVLDSTLIGVRYYRIELITDLNVLKRDEYDRVTFYAEFDVHKDYS